MSDVTIPGPLDLSGADTTGFTPVDSGKYKAVIYDAEWRAVKNEGGATPVGTPMLSVEFKLNEKVGAPDYDVEGRRVWSTYVIPPKGHDEKKAAKLKGMLVNFLVASGYEESEVTSKKFSIDIDDLKGREIGLIVGIRQADDDKGWPAQNTVKGVRRIDDIGGSGGGSQGLL